MLDFRYFCCVLTLVSNVACASVDNPKGKTTDGLPEENISEEYTPAPPGAIGPISDALNPIFLFPGGSAGFSDSFTDMTPAATQLQRLGFPQEHIHIMTYDDSKDKAEIIRSLGIKLAQIINTYPSTTKFDVIGHSLGHPVALIAMAENGYLSRTGRIIGIAGIMFGQNAGKPFLCRIRPSLCGDLYDSFSRTNDPEIIRQLLATHAEEMSEIKKCSFYSPQDGMLDPVDSGKFPDGINVSIPNIRHLGFKSSEVVFDAIKEACF